MVKIFNDERGFGFISVPGETDDLYFQRRDLDQAVQALLPGNGGPGIAGKSVAFRWETLPDGRYHAREVQLSDVAAPPPPPSWGPKGGGKGGCCGKGMGGQIFPGAEVSGAVKSFNEEKGYGFIGVHGHEHDLYFQRRDMDQESQAFLSQVGGAGIRGCEAWCRLEQLPDGRWVGRAVHVQVAGAGGSGDGASAAPVGDSGLLVDGARLSGSVKNFFDAKGFGFITVPGESTDLYFQLRDLTPQSQAQLQQGVSLPGASVGFTLQATQGTMPGRWRCKDVNFMQPEEERELGKSTLPPGSEDGNAAKRQKVEGEAEGAPAPSEELQAPT